jgi:hypothetical protein
MLLQVTKWRTNNLDKELSMNIPFESETEEFNDAETPTPEASPSKKLERRRKIEDLFEEKRLKEELEEFG